MKKNIFKQWGFALMIALMGFGTAAFTSCNDDKDNSEEGTDAPKDKWANFVNEKVKENGFDAGFFIYGWSDPNGHSYQEWGNIDLNATTFNKATGGVYFTNIPSGFNEFKTVYEKYLGKSLQGTAAMIPMAFEIYARDRATGLKCLNLLCDREQTVTPTVRRLNDLFDAKVSDGARYLPATMLEGAKYDNAYTPTLVSDMYYNVQTCRAANAPQDTDNPSYGKVYYVYIFMDGYEGGKKQVEIFKANNSDYYKVQNCANVYARPKKIDGEWQGLK